MCETVLLPQLAKQFPLQAAQMQPEAKDDLVGRKRGSQASHVAVHQVAPAVLVFEVGVCQLWDGGACRRVLCQPQRLPLHCRKAANALQLRQCARNSALAQ